MRILFLSTWFPYPPDNGSKIRVYHLLRALGARHEVTLVSFAFATAKPEGVAKLRRFCAQVEPVWRDPFDFDLVVRILRFLSPVPIMTLPVPEMTQAVRRSMARSNFDVVIASTEVMTTYALMAPRGTVKILEDHNSMTRWAWDQFQDQTSAIQHLRRGISWQKNRYYESRLFRKFDLCVMVSEQDRRASQQMLPGYKGRVEVVPNGVDCRSNCSGLALSQPNALIFNGALTYHANYDAMRYFLNEIYPRIHRQIPEVALTITGSTSGVDLTGLRLDESVRLSGYVDDVRLLVAGASVCVVPIRQGSGSRLKILEAMALGTPVVSTSKGAEGLDAIDGKHIVLADDPETFANETVRLLRDPVRRQWVAANARSLVEQGFDWAQLGERFVRLVEDAVNRNPQELIPEAQ